MSSTARHRRVILAITAAIAILATTPATADAVDPAPSVQAQIDAYLAAAPDGIQINANEVSYGKGAMIVTFKRGTSTASLTPDCPSGWFCLYDRVNYSYPRARFQSCGWQDLYNWGWHDRTESVHYNMSTGWVSFINHGGDNHSGDVQIFSISTGKRGIFDVAPYRNGADHIERYC